MEHVHHVAGSARSGPGGCPPVNKGLLVTDIFSELGKGVNQAGGADGR